LDGNEQFDELMNKLDNATVQICKPLFNSGVTIKMDNYYMSTTCAMKLQKKGVYCRGTIRSSRKFIPKSILNKAVHFVSTADTTDTITVQRRVGGTKVDVPAPIAISNYNKYMGGVDRHDRLRSAFSLCKKHKFKKYYVKLLLFIIDIGLTNSWIYYKMCNEQKCKEYGSRADFFQSVAEMMVNSDINWKKNI
jgi:hypothetical protein